MALEPNANNCCNTEGRVSKKYFSYLTLSKRDGTQFLRESHLIGKLVQISSRVCPCRQDKDKRGGGGGVLKH